MGYDLNFWNESAGFKAEPLNVYRSLSGGASVEGLNQIDVDSFYKRII